MGFFFEGAALPLGRRVVTEVPVGIAVQEESGLEAVRLVDDEGVFALTGGGAEFDGAVFGLGKSCRHSGQASWLGG